MFRRLRAKARALPLAVLLAAAPVLGSGSASAEPAIWRVADADSVVWVFGSVHALPPELDWRRPEIDRAMATASIVYFEITIDPETELEIQRQAIAVGFNPPGVNLTDLLSAEGRARLERMANDLGVSLTPFQRLKPWLAVVALDALVTEAEGATTDAGVDAVLEAEAHAAAKDVRALETPEVALAYLAELSDEDQIMLLEETLILYESFPSFGKDLEAAWLAGDLERLETLLLGALEKLPPAVYDRLVRERNLDWAEQIDAFIAGGAEDAFVIVGAGHMLGEDSLVGMLEARGYTVERR